ncbi:MAG: major facilitator superfamily 1 [Polyangiaceae bacterium]|nr:major facilitator superfamily 1 [Polyangiaceae bacterium]
MSPVVTGRPPPALVALFALGAGLAAASLYYNQPILVAMARSLGATTAQIGVVPMLTQLGYASGILLFAPFGDRRDRRQVIVVKLVTLSLSLTAAGLAQSVAVLAVASLAIGLSATAAQDFVPAAAALAPPESRGKVVGTVMTGLLLGILLSRLASGAVSDRYGWRVVYFGAAGIIAALAALSAARVPSIAPSTREPYGKLLRSMLALARDLSALRRATLAQALLSFAFSAFWSTLALSLAAPPHRLGSTAAGLFGLAGAAGAAVAPVAGALADKRGPETVIRAGAALVVISFASMALWPASLGLLIVGTVVFDLGVQASLIAHQTIIYGLDGAARSRLNAILVSSMFLGMSLGAAVASSMLSRHGWAGVMLLGAGASAAALVVRYWPAQS